MPLQKKTVTKVLSFLLTGFLCFVILAAPEPAYASDPFDFGAKLQEFLGSAKDVVGNIFTTQIPALFSWLILLLAQGFAYLASLFGTWVVKLGMFNNFVNSPMVNLGWPVVRDITNIFFIVVLVVIAFGTIVGSEEYGWRHRLPSLIFAIFIVNFSKIILGFAIDVVQIITLTFFSALSSDGGGGFVDVFKLGELATFTNGQLGDFSGGASWDGTRLLFTSFIALALLVSITGLLGSMVFRLFMRAVVLMFCIVLAPLAFLARAFPPLEHSYELWHHEFIENLTYGPGIAFALWLVVAVASQSDFSWAAIITSGDFGSLLGGSQTGFLGSEIAHAQGATATSFDYMINFAGNFVMFTASMQFAEKLSAGSTGAAKAFGSKVAGMARGVGMRALGGAGRLGGQAAMGVASTGASFASKGASGGVMALAGGLSGAVGGAFAARSSGQNILAGATSGARAGASRGFNVGAQAPTNLVNAPGKMVKKVKEFGESARLRATTLGQGETGQIVRQAAVAKEEREELNKQESKYGGMSASQVAQGMSAKAASGQKSQLERAALGQLGKDKNLQRAAGIEYMKSDEAAQRFKGVDINDTTSANEFNQFVQQSSAGSESIAKEMRDAMLQRQSLVTRSGSGAGAGASTQRSASNASGAREIDLSSSGVQVGAQSTSNTSPQQEDVELDLASSPAPTPRSSQTTFQPPVQRPAAPTVQPPPPQGSPFGDMEAASSGAPEPADKIPLSSQPAVPNSSNRNAPTPPPSAPAAASAPQIASQSSGGQASGATAANQPQNQPPQGGAPAAQIDAAQLQAAFKQAGGQMSNQLRAAIKSAIGVDPLNAPQLVNMLRNVNNEQLEKLRALGAKNKQRLERGEMPVYVTKILNQGGSQNSAAAPRRAA